ncbi:MAG: HYR domain-containing protein, partial [Flavobacteriales bacterium]|nr:HYR domain-containing protein [Flavobacteriales bacterium]
SFEVNITDDEAPSVTCQQDINEYVDSNCEFILPDYTINAITTDNCDNAPVLTQLPLPGTLVSSANHVELITITSTDMYGNSNSCSFNVTLIDTIAPSIVCIEDQIEYANELCEFTLPDYTGMTLSDDNCSTPVITQVPAAGTIFSLGEVEITMTSTDPDGNSTACTFMLTILDNTPPSVLCPANQIEALTDACEFEIPDYRSMVTAGDNCSDVTILQVPEPGTIISENTTVQMTVTDEFNNSSICTFEVILEDYIAPEIICPADINTTADAGICGAIVNYELPETYDNCTVASLDLSAGLASGSEFPVGTTTVSYLVTDGFGNTAECSFEVTVTDDEAPSIICPEDIVAESDLGVCGALVMYDLPVIDDNCATASLVMIEGLASGSTFPVGTTTLTYEVVDLHGNASTCSFNITVLDVEAPTVLSCNSTILVANDLDECGAIVTYNTPEAADNCEVVSTTMISGLASGEQFPVGSTMVTYSFLDPAGNETLCSFEVIVEDTQVPNITCQEDITVFNDFGICGASVIYNLPLISDNCAIDSMVMIEGMESGSTFDVGTTNIAFQVTDIHGNQNTCSFTITVIDAEDPVIMCPEDISQEDAYVEYPLPVFTDNCGASIELIDGLESGSVFPHGYTTVTYLAIDEAGNTSECSFEVLINTPPVGVDDEADHFEEDDEIIIDVLANDYDLDGDDIFISDVSSDNAEVYIENGMLIYEPLGEWCGTDTVTYIVCDPFMSCDTAQVIVQVECFIDLIIPEGFSPNADGVNDTFEILGLEDYPGNVLTIFNRWGHKVFEAEEYQSDWDGTSQSILTIGSSYLPEGTYFYVLELGNVPIKPVKGYVYLNH